jgi:DNA helicase-2/ATP-dependent DNA helicase PcrA
MSGYATMLKSDNSIEGQARAENVEELFNSIKSFVEEAEAEAELYEPMQQEGGALTGEDSLLQDSLQQESLPGQDVALLDVRPSVLLGDFLETISLMSAVDDNSQEDDTNKVTLMTVHSAKGLEFGHVYIIGLEENLFPSINSSSSENEIEEERRLMYVALTRAKKSVTISYAQTRFRWGTHVNYPPSRFLREIDKEFLNWPDLESADSPFSASSWGKGASLPRESGSYRGQGPSRENGSSASAAPFTRKPQFTPPKPPNPNFQADPVSKLKEGQKVEHDRFGFGTLLKIEGDPLNLKAIVEFEQGGRKILLLKFAKLRVIE